LNIYEKAKKGLPLDDVLIIDCHCHMGPWQHFNVPKGTAEGMLESMNSLGVDIACPTAHASIGPDYVHGNNMVIDAVKKYPDRFAGYITINPNYPDDIKNELDRCFAIDGMVGIKLHPSCHGRTIEHRNYNIAYEAANSLKCPVLIHVWGKGDVMMIDRVAARYPEASLIMGHAGADIDAMEIAMDVVKKHKNVYVDIAISRAREGNVEWLVNGAGSEKILYGTDMPFFDPRPTFGRLAYANISEEDKRNIFGLNMKRIIERYRAVRE